MFILLFIIFESFTIKKNLSKSKNNIIIIIRLVLFLFVFNKVFIHSSFEKT